MATAFSTMTVCLNNHLRLTNSLLGLCEWWLEEHHVAALYRLLWQLTVSLVIDGFDRYSAIDENLYCCCFFLVCLFICFKIWFDLCSPRAQWQRNTMPAFTRDDCICSKDKLWKKTSQLIFPILKVFRQATTRISNFFYVSTGCCRFKSNLWINDSTDLK